MTSDRPDFTDPETWRHSDSGGASRSDVYETQRPVLSEDAWRSLPRNRAVAAAPPPPPSSSLHDLRDSYRCRAADAGSCGRGSSSRSRSRHSGRSSDFLHDPVRAAAAPSVARSRSSSRSASGARVRSMSASAFGDSTLFQPRPAKAEQQTRVGVPVSRPTRRLAPPADSPAPQPATQPPQPVPQLALRDGRFTAESAYLNGMLGDRSGSSGAAAGGEKWTLPPCRLTGARASLPPVARPCLYFAKGTCVMGERCRFLHLDEAEAAAAAAEAAAAAAPPPPPPPPPWVSVTQAFTTAGAQRGPEAQQQPPPSVSKHLDFDQISASASAASSQTTLSVSAQ